MVEICVVLLVYLICVIVGGVVIKILLFKWFLLIMVFGLLFMVVGKCYVELYLVECIGVVICKLLESYISIYLWFVWMLLVIVVVLCYGLWVFECDGYSGFWFVVLMILFIIVILCYVVDVDGGLVGELEDIVLCDWVL